MIQRGLSVDDVERLLAAAPANWFSRLTGGIAWTAERLARSVATLLRIVIVALQWGAVRHERQMLLFKARMIERGLSIVEVERLLAAQPPAWPVRLAAALGQMFREACLACRRFAQSLPAPTR
jgi:hypothetical protein